ncbi:MAG: 50S ribosomal protein L32 [Candidatus Nealsonbacteria bacterium RIFCSPLOWO2_12_FULL_39_31]|uniref:Large ribosomal subunit protein bL32 n=3 Tax=Candidatus Nealsoniibacteriota TaxID=1817911 RepID=A0A1G2EH50_9BACT|nr:MAG: 50S ribosomal protein L32 [Parcubacteria group bacterium GW2011_GWA2_38_27]OGZ19532.1 MAG: 50S ribosomal protein L32 [Candidatus Nealsonbacteria bacterium RIFCSPHIGHO2_01_FULL_38_55]OGZ20909.1 MAG: 50S ribosomal protein L32 [Candidatus Nealsonbacteria bacterium RIFCSPHIGHO2_02_FULL_38_75]OGZ21004.1 MAG: 50S ribosomal protein L32 [Candidatus Nealsonbacteria bacterium RIFCSPHIGHO2_02_38_10]OGZ22821.1 MAG: 50S ribosomal protein L32 [Candidatus Nealsonbacteria bacterium RIFCSPHIGHO2_12_FULL
MAVPKRKRSSSRRDQRRMHIFIKPFKLTACLKCGKPVLPHTICRSCGFYKGQEFIDVLSKLTKKEKKQKEKEMAETEKGGSNTKPLSMEEMSKK